MLLKTYLIIYFALLAAAFVSLWQGRILARLPFGWVGLAFLAAVLLGVVLALVSRHKPPNPA